MEHIPDIVFTLDGAAFDTYRVTPQTPRGESFVSALISTQTTRSEPVTVSADQAHEFHEIAGRCGLAVQME